MKSGVYIVLAICYCFLQKVYGQTLPCLAEVEKYAQAGMTNTKETLPQIKVFYENHQKDFPVPCVIQLEYTIGFLELQNLRIDSADRYMNRFLEHSLQTGKDSTVVEGYLWYSTFMRITNRYEQAHKWLDSTQSYLKRKQIEDKYLNGKYYTAKADYLNLVTHDVKGAERYYMLSLETRKTAHGCDECHVTLNNLGYMFMNEGYLQKAAHYFYQSLLATEKITKSDEEKKYLQSNTMLNLSFCYRMLHRPTEAIEYAQQVFDNSRKIESNTFLLRSYRHLAAALMENKQYDKALKLLKEAEKICLRFKQKDEMGYTYRYLGELYALYLNNETEGKWYLEKSKALIEEIQDSDSYHLHNYSLGRFYLHEKNYPEALRLLTLSLEQGRKVHDRVYEPVILELLYKAWQQEGNYAKALGYYTQFVQLRDSIASDETQLKLKELEKKYDEQVNQLVINKLQNTNQNQKAELDRKERTILFILGIGFLVSAILFLLYTTQKSKKRIAQQKEQLAAQQLRELQQQKQLEIYTAMLNGQETERSRLARDLHDGLGGMLAGTKLYLSQINQKVMNGQAVYLQTAVVQIDNSMQELRRIARNMMPETLVKFGLKTALRDLCESLQNSQLQIRCQTMGLSSDLSKSIQLTIYRVIQELITNAIKHANAQQILVQCLQNEGSIHITIEDDGQGFDTASIKGNGVGLSNVRNRVEYLNGRLEIQSEPGVGTTVTVEIPV
ncbi:sensor histidine kinase [Cytophagaceae bacterium DM2B3-1]|uniref:Oxygen sensor histidine kinase NreB n=1 Tax=Xanthocytophaga flava TaxID=3048013 RepID=A0ABT7CIP9_9BACT|nr:sensor histidine kinase [Xanthocytophaga flavus]MDJ1493603.1 sensor histidine kinase [Xanthocytophaga flavus]